MCGFESHPRHHGAKGDVLGRRFCFGFGNSKNISLVHVGNRFDGLLLRVGKWISPYRSGMRFIHYHAMSTAYSRTGGMGMGRVNRFDLKNVVCFLLLCLLFGWGFRLVSIATASDTRIGVDGQNLSSARGLSGKDTELHAPDAGFVPAESRLQRPPGNGEIWTDPATGMVFVWVSGGCYQMGCKACNAFQGGWREHEVCVDGFWMGKYEVTQGEWQKLMGANPAFYHEGSYARTVMSGGCSSNRFARIPAQEPAGGFDLLPASHISWNDTQEFLSAMNVLKTGVYRLPTEAEWEYAAKGGIDYNPKSEPKDCRQMGWLGLQSEFRLHQVGLKEPNILGLYDMVGNVSEWCEDKFEENYYNFSSRINPQGPGEGYPLHVGEYRVIRGGDITSTRINLSDRFFSGPDWRGDRCGFRVVKLLETRQKEP